MIDSAQVEHIEAVWAMLRRFATSYEPSRSAFDRDFPQLVLDERAYLLVARWNEQIVDYLMAHRMPTLFAGGPILQIVELFVDDDLRSNGIGGALVLAALEGVWATGCVETVVPTRRASGFYRQLGFEPSAEFLKYKRTTKPE